MSFWGRSVKNTVCSSPLLVCIFGDFELASGLGRRKGNPPRHLADDVLLLPIHDLAIVSAISSGRTKQKAVIGICSRARDFS